MRIAFVSLMSGFSWGGSEELWAAAARSARIQGHEVAVCTFRGPQRPGKLSALVDLGCRYYPRSKLFQRFNSVRSHSKYIDYLLFSRHDPIRSLFRWKPDVICVSEGIAFESALDPVLPTLLSKRRIPFVIVCQANSDWNIPGDSSRQTALRIYGDSHRVVFVSDHNCLHGQKQLARQLTHCVVLRNPVNLSTVGRVECPTSGMVEMANVARLDVKLKGQDVLFATMAEPQWLEREWRLNMYGAGSSANYLRDLSRYYKIDDRVQFYGHVDDIAEVWSRNHLLVMPSRAEGTPLALVEAMLCGRPSVVTDVGGNAEWVRDGIDGFVAAASTKSLFSKALERAWQARDRWLTIGQSAHERAMQLYDPEPGASLLNLLLEAGYQTRNSP